MTFDTIYSRMAQVYAQAAGFPPEDAADAALRLRAVAAEIYAALCELDAVRAAAFPQTAEDEALDLHAGERGLMRKPAVQASGTLTFLRETPLSYDAEIPAGTVCAASGAAVEFETTEPVVLPAGQLRVTAQARAVLGGKAYNAAVGAVDTLVTPPAGIEAVTNETAFTGGTDTEPDDALRRRLLQCYSVLPNGANSETYRRAALEVPGVSHASVVPRENGSGTVSVYLYGDGAAVTDGVRQAVQEKLDALREINVTVSVLDAEPVDRLAVVYIRPKPGCAFEDARAACMAALHRCNAQYTIGDPYCVAALTAALMQTGLIQNCAWPYGTGDYNTPADKIVVLNEIDVVQMA